MVQLRGYLGRAPKEPSSPSLVSTQSFEITFTGSFHENNKRVTLTMENFFVAYTGKDGRDGIHGRVEYCFYSSCSGKYYGYAYTDPRKLPRLCVGERCKRFYAKTWGRVGGGGIRNFRANDAKYFLCSHGVAVVWANVSGVRDYSGQAAVFFSGDGVY